MKITPQTSPRPSGLFQGGEGFEDFVEGGGFGGGEVFGEVGGGDGGSGGVEGGFDGADALG